MIPHLSKIEITLPLYADRGAYTVRVEAVVHSSVEGFPTHMAQGLVWPSSAYRWTVSGRWEVDHSTGETPLSSDPNDLLPPYWDKLAPGPLDVSLLPAPGYRSRSRGISGYRVDFQLAYGFRLWGPVHGRGGGRSRHSPVSGSPGTCWGNMVLLRLVGLDRFSRLVGGIARVEPRFRWGGPAPTSHWTRTLQRGLP